jgi:diacylglycerol kinase (ATP)
MNTQKGKRMNGLFWRRIVLTSRNSWQGLRYAWHNEEAFRVELVLMLLACPLALWLGETGMERAMLLLPCVLVLVVELLNSAVEAAIDHTSMEQHPLAAAAKDLGSAAVLLSLLLVPVVWALVLI